MDNYLIVKCIPLGDQWECDADRQPLLVCSEEQAVEGYFEKYGYEIYLIKEDGSLELIKEYDE